MPGTKLDKLDVSIGDAWRHNRTAGVGKPRRGQAEGHQKSRTRGNYVGQ